MADGRADVNRHTILIRQFGKDRARRPMSANLFSITRYNDGHRQQLC